MRETAEEMKEFRGTEVLHDTPKCKICGGRTALIKGIFCYEAHDEPYVNGVGEESEVSEGECWVGAYKCDKCDNIQGLWTE